MKARTIAALFIGSLTLTTAQAAWSQCNGDCGSMPIVCQAGEDQRWIFGCETSAVAGWDGASKESSRNECTAAAPWATGQAMIQARTHVLSSNNGSHSVSTYKSGQKFDFARKIDEAYNAAIDAAYEKGDEKTAAKIKQAKRQALAESVKFEASDDMVRITVQASGHGSFVDRKRGWEHARADLLVRCIAPVNLEEQVFKRFGLQKTASITASPYHAYFRNAGTQNALFHCVSVANQNINRDLPPNETDNIAVQSDYIECCHSYKSVPTTNSCYKIKGGELFVATARNAVD